MFLSFDIEGEKVLSRKLINIGDKLTDFTPAFKEITQYLDQTFAEKSFSSKGSVFGPGYSWRPLAASTLRQKTRKGYSLEPLVATGRMQDSIVGMSKNDESRLWSDLPYFKYHQSKMPRKGNLPRRVMMYLAATQRAKIIRIFQTELKNKLK